ncbi:MAG: hypothetical protein M1834_001038 [Cirrosporium novae-zelandiae]|nr:MAG: hypothetical protein M1834_001038 [Cirrosporium novae-zelandiae]
MATANSTQPLADQPELTSSNDTSQGPSPDTTADVTNKLANEARISSGPSSENIPPTGGVIKNLFPHPLPTAQPVPLPALTADQEAKYNDLLKTASSWTEIADSAAKNPPKSPITEDERMWLTKECLLRYLRASKWNLHHAEQRVLGTMTWRREYGVEGFTSEYISPENETGKQIIFGYDINGRTCHYMAPARQNTKKSDRQIHHVVWMLEREIDILPPGQETICLLINFKESSSGSNPSIAQGKQVLDILQNHYPERLGRALIINVPWFVWGFFKVITPFIDPLTREKLHFNEDLTKHVPPSQLTKAFGGEVDFEYDHSVYWPGLTQLAEQRRKDMHERWVKGGKQIGEHEGYLRGGIEKSLSGLSAQPSGGGSVEEKKTLETTVQSLGDLSIQA